MLRKIATAVGYAKAPRATFIAKHPKRGLVALGAVKGWKHSRTVRRSAKGLVGLGFGLGALSVALPVLGARALRR